MMPALLVTYQVRRIGIVDVPGPTPTASGSLSPRGRPRPGH
jgi:hypothetical protein